MATAHVVHLNGDGGGGDHFLGRTKQPLPSSEKELEGLKELRRGAEGHERSKRGKGD